MFKRALITAALSAAFAAPVYADVTISGSAELDLFVRTNQANGTDGGATAFGNETDLIINFDGSDKLDYGDKLIWHVGQKIATPGAAAWGSREAYVGLAGNWGTFRSGRVFTPSYLALDAFQWGAGDVWEDYGANGVWFKEAVAYTTPTFAGFGAQVAYDFGSKTAQGQTWAVDAIATYNNEVLNLVGGYQQQNGIKGQEGNKNGFNVDDVYFPGGDTGVKQEFYFAQGEWKIGNGFSVRGGWKHNKWSDENNVITSSNKNGFKNTAENDQFLVAGGYTTGKHSIGLGWTDIVNSKADGVEQSDHDMDEFFGQYTYALSKNTVTFVQARYHKFKDENTRPFVSSYDGSSGTSFDSIATTGTGDGARLLIGTWTAF